MKLVISNEEDKRSLKEILDDINEVASTMGYVAHMAIIEDISEIWRRYGESEGEDDSN